MSIFYQVEISTLPGKDGKTHIKLRSSTPTDLERAVTMVTNLSSEILLEGVELTEDRFDMASTIIRSGAGHLYNVVFKDEEVKPKVNSFQTNLRSILCSEN